MGIYFPNAHLQFHSNNFGCLLFSYPFLRLQQPLCIYSREHNVTFVFSRIWPRRLCSCKWIQVLRLTARSSSDINGSGSLHTWSPELSESLWQRKHTLPHPASLFSPLCSALSRLFFFLELPPLWFCILASVISMGRGKTWRARVELMLKNILQ